MRFAVIVRPKFPIPPEQVGMVIEGFGQWREKYRGNLEVFEFFAGGGGGFGIAQVRRRGVAEPDDAREPDQLLLGHRDPPHDGRRRRAEAVARGGRDDDGGRSRLTLTGAGQPAPARAGPGGAWPRATPPAPPRACRARAAARPPRPGAAAGISPTIGAMPWKRALAELLVRADQHLAERLAGADAEQVDVGLALAAGLAPDALRQLADREHDRRRTAPRAGTPSRGQQRAVRGERRRVRHRDPVAEHPGVGDGERHARARLLQEELRRAAGASRARSRSGRPRGARRRGARRRRSAAP